MMEITSRQNPRYKFACSLDSKRARKQAGALLVEGSLEIKAMLAAKLEILDLMYCGEYASDTENNLVVAAENQSGRRRMLLSTALMAKLSYRKSSGLVVVCKPPVIIAPEALVSGLVLILEEPAKPGNLGAIVRTASGLGASAVVTIGSSVDCWNANAIRASIGSVFGFPVLHYGSWDAFLSEHHGLELVGMHPDGQQIHQSTSTPQDVGLVFGTESAGLSPEAKQACQRLVRIPMSGVVDSLNLSVCVGIATYAWKHQN